VFAVLSVVQKQSSRQAPVRVTVYDAVGIGAGGSGAAAGLLHPFAPTGKVCCFAASMHRSTAG
jgi:glycine/D-amino acid oxidase-like deaminating enzyme